MIAVKGETTMISGGHADIHESAGTLIGGNEPNENERTQR